MQNRQVPRSVVVVVIVAGRAAEDGQQPVAHPRQVVATVRLTRIKVRTGEARGARHTRSTMVSSPQYNI